jgi:hypothetical protein
LAGERFGAPIELIVEGVLIAAAGMLRGHDLR